MIACAFLLLLLLLLEQQVLLLDELKGLREGKSKDGYCRVIVLFVVCPMCGVGQDLILPPYMTVYLVISQPKIPYICTVYICGSGQRYPCVIGRQGCVLIVCH